MADDRKSPGAPIIICAPVARSGTTFCKYLISSHPNTYRADLKEDFLLHNAKNLQEYVDGLFKVWEGMDYELTLAPGRRTPDSLLSAMGDVLLTHIGRRESPDRMVLKTPRLCDLEVALRLFPGCQILIMIRDPRSILSSYLRAQKSWGSERSFEQVAKLWAESIRNLSSVLAENQPAVRSKQLILVRYEKLVSNTEAELRGLLEKLGLPVAQECIDAANNPVVRGSSYLPFINGERVNFQPQPMPDGFDPLVRWKDWTPERLARFNRICGSLMNKWGYQPIDETNR